MCFPSGISLFLKPPVSVLVILYSVAMFCVCAAASASSARFSMKTLLSALVFLLTSLSSSEYLLCIYSAAVPSVVEIWRRLASFLLLFFHQLLSMCLT